MPSRPLRDPTGTGRDTVVGESSGFVIFPGSHGWLSRYTTYYESDYDVRENLQVDTAKAWRVSLPIHGGFGVKFENSSREP